MITLSKIKKSYKQNNFALEDINLNIQDGEIFGIIGRSGAGKSTLVRCINLLERPQTGQVTLNNQDLTKLNNFDLRKARQKIGMIFQHFNLLESRTALENILFPLEIAKWDKTKALEKAQDLLKLVGLPEYDEFYPRELSGGQRQRIAIARALANDPKVLLCDEATSSLDPETTLSILQLLKQINQELKLTIVLITHEMEVIKSICQRAAIIESGKIAEVAKVIDIFSKPKAEPTRSLINAAMHLELPPNIKKHLSKTHKTGYLPIARFAFVGDQINQPLIALIAEKFSVEANIFHATTEWLGDMAIGVSICELKGSGEKIKQALTYSKEQGVNVEVRGYVPADVTTIN